MRDRIGEISSVWNNTELSFQTEIFKRYMLTMWRAFRDFI